MAEPIRTPEFVTVGSILGAFGPDGRVRVAPLTDFPDRLLELEEVRVTRPGPQPASSGRLRVLSAEEAGGSYILTLEGVASRGQAAALRGSRLEIPATGIRPLPPGQFYRFQVVGLEVREESGHRVGRVSEILETGANDVYVVSTGSAPGAQGSDRSKEVLIPALKDVVLKIDPAAGLMVVRLPREWGGSS